jgi:hypothetical protein
VFTGPSVATAMAVAAGFENAADTTVVSEELLHLKGDFLISR